MQKKAKNRKFDQLVDTASKLFLRYGLHRVTIEEICRNASVSKMTFYKHFANKTDLINYILKKIFQESEASFKEIIRQEISFPEKINKIICLKLEWNQKFSGEFFQELIQSPDIEIQRIVEMWRQNNLKWIMQFFSRAQKRGDIRPDIKLEFILYILNKMFELAKDENLLAIYDNHVQVTAELTNFFFFGIFPKTKRSRVNDD